MARPRPAKPAPPAGAGRPRGRRAMPTASGSRSPSGYVRTTRTFLRVSAAVHARSFAREVLVEVVDQRLDGRRVRGRLGVSRRSRAEVHRLRRRSRDCLDVGRVAAGRADELVLAVLGHGEELLALRPAHGTGGRLDHDVVEAEPVEDPDVRRTMCLVRGGETRRRRCRTSTSPSSRTRGHAGCRRAAAPRRGTSSGFGTATAAGPCTTSTGPSPSA